MNEVCGLILAGRRRDLVRNGALTQHPMALAPVANRPLVAYALDRMRQAGIAEVGIVTGPEGTGPIGEVVADGSAWGVRVTYLEQAEPLGDAHALLAGEVFAGGRPLLVHRGDSLLKQDIRPVAQAFTREKVDALVLLQRVADPRRHTVAELRQGRLLRLVRHPMAPTTNVAMAGVYFVGPAVFAACRRIAPSWRGELEVVDALARVVEDGGRVATRSVAGWWQYDGSPADLLEGNRLVLEDLIPDHADADLQDSRVQGRVKIHPTARLESTVVRGPAVVGAGVRLCDAYIGPYTAIGDDVFVEGAEIENSIVLPGAVVQHLGGRLEASVVGRDAKVFRDFALPKAMRLWVGDGVEVSLV